MNNRPVSFPQWKEVLARASLSAAEKTSHQREIITFLHHCKVTHSPATVAGIKLWLAGPRLQVKRPGLPAGAEQAREALRWFYRNAPKEASDQGSCTDSRPATPFEGGLRSTRSAAALGNAPIPELATVKESVLGTNRSTADSGTSHQRPPSRATEPPPAAGDLGGSPWEHALIRTCRERNLSWRTEQTYREWAVRFARFIAPRSPEAANGAEVAAFLTELALQGRASASAQKQALNALVFFMERALGRVVGEMDFKRAYPRVRIPTILSGGETRSLFAQLEGTPRLMAELAYGSGLRLMELLRLRVHHLDLERLRLQVHAGKGDKDRVTVLPEKLVPGLRAHLTRLHALWEEDRTAALPGVWLPEGLAKKYQGAGLKWEWQWVFPSRVPGIDPATGIKRRHHVSDAWFQRLIKRAAQEAGLYKRVTPHVLRHCFGTHLLENGTDIRTLVELMGHESLETTKIYLHVMDKPGMGLKSPLDGLGPSPLDGLEKAPPPPATK